MSPLPYFMSRSQGEVTAMRILVLVAAVVCVRLPGCGWTLWEDEGRSVQGTGRGVNLGATRQEERAMQR